MTMCRELDHVVDEDLNINRDIIIIIITNHKSEYLKKYNSQFTTALRELVAVRQFVKLINTILTSLILPEASSNQTTNM